jgi:peptidoglycan/xylan/chitin deacetylase (PgdA/CDA1 family)
MRRWRAESGVARASSLLVLSSLLFCLGTARAQANDPATPGPLASSGNGHGISSELIRHHRLRHLDAHLTIDPAVLREQCRYESEISTAPPAKKVVLTFDDGPEPEQTELILKTLRQYGIPGAFFVVGHKVKEHPELLEMILHEGHHVVGNHSWDHPNFHAIDPAAQALEVVHTRSILALPGTHGYFRYPFGNSTCESNALVRSMGYSIVGWHIDSCDWAFDARGEVDAREAMICGVLPQNRKDFVGHVVSRVRAHNGGIVLLHEIHPKTVRQLDAIIKSILADGYTFASLTDPEFSTALR